MYEALAMVRRELGPDAAILHTRTVPTRRLLGWLAGPPQIEVTASCGVNVPSRLPGDCPDFCGMDAAKMGLSPSGSLAVGHKMAPVRFAAADEAGWEAAAEEEELTAAAGTSLRQRRAWFPGPTRPSLLSDVPPKPPT